MKKEDIIKYKDQKVQLLISNNFRYKGILLDCDDESLKLLDKFKQEVTIRLQDIMIFSPLFE